MTYRVTVHADMEQLLADIRNRDNEDYPKNRWPSKDFEDRQEAQEYALMARLALSREATVRWVGIDPYGSLRDRINKRWPNE